MSEFDAFQTATATFKKITKDGAGDESTADSITVKIDPVFGYQKIYTKDGEEITGESTIISEHTSDLQDFYDQTHRGWKLTYNGFDYIVKNPKPFYRIGTTILEHIEITLT